MKIVHVITAFGIGGAEKLLLNVINKQIENHQVFLIYFKDKNDLVSDLNTKVNVSQIKIDKNIIKNLKKCFKKIDPDVIHTHLGHADFFGLWASRNFRAKKFCTMHNIYFKKNLLDVIFFSVYKLLFNKYLKNCNVISISQSVKNHAQKKLKVKLKNSHLLFNAIPFKKIEFSKQNEQIKLLFIGRLEKQKSLSTFLEALSIIRKEYPKLQFSADIVGSGNLKEDLEGLTTKLKIDNVVTFKGEQKNVDKFYANADMFILPSIWEGFGIVILEAFRAKVAVIATNIEGPSELIKNGENGLLFEPRNALQLSEKIIYLIENFEERERIALNGYNTFTKKYSIKNYVEQLEKLYKNV